MLRYETVAMTRHKYEMSCSLRLYHHTGGGQRLCSLIYQAGFILGDGLSMMLERCCDEPSCKVTGMFIFYLPLSRIWALHRSQSGNFFTDTAMPCCQLSGVLELSWHCLTVCRASLTTRVSSCASCICTASWIVSSCCASRS
jgi:hypothetical protein